MTDTMKRYMLLHNCLWDKLVDSFLCYFYLRTQIKTSTSIPYTLGAQQALNSSTRLLISRILQWKPSKWLLGEEGLKPQRWRAIVSIYWAPTMRQELHIIILKGRCHNPHLIEKKTEAQRNQVTCTRAQVGRYRSGVQNQILLALTLVIILSKASKAFL